MTKEEAMAFMDNLIICIKEHPILADWLVEIENRKAEPQTCIFNDCDNFKNPDYARCIKCKQKQIELTTEPQTDCPETCPSIDICTRDDTDCAWKKGHTNDSRRTDQKTE